MAQKVAGTFPVFLNENATSVAKKLLGCYLIRDIGDHVIKAKIVETESYDQADAASHSFNGRTARTDVMFGESGYLYVYFTYGLHYCCNVVTGAVGDGEAVLIRAVEPIEGRDFVEHHRGKTGIDATNGPAKLCQALDIDKRLNGHNLRYFPLRLETGLPVPSKQIMEAPRIGISKEREALRRFYIRDNAYVSNG
jgi:DNA-3-methyladenine glycosylase